MKKLLLALFLGFALYGFSQTTNKTAYSYVLDEYWGVSSDVPSIRRIGGGSKFIVTYEGDWTNEMKGAFEYACKIWEEQIPTALPIRITAKIGYVFSSGNPLSEIVAIGEDYMDEIVLNTRVKGVYMGEMIGPQFLDTRFANIEWLEGGDGSITYNKNRIDDFSFSLYPQSTDKYDFVTIALRDLARLLGFSWNNQADPIKQTLDIQGEKLTPFEANIAQSIGTSDVYEAYKKTTQGSLDIVVEYGNKMKLYAPDPWIKGLSLNYFIPDSTKRLTELLSYKVGRGSVIRNISDNYSNLFAYGLGWKPYIAVGGGGGGSELPSSTETVIPFQGNININKLGRTNIVNSLYDDETLLPSTRLGYEEELEVKNFLYQYCTPYHPNLCADGTIGEEGWSVSFLKEDGTWDVLYELRGSPSIYPLELSTADLDFKNVDSYARTYDGYLRCRISSYDYVRYFDHFVLSGGSKYYVLDFLPQKPKIQFVKVMPTTYNFVDEYSRTIKIAIRDLEGTDKIIVEQLEEGEKYPQKYEVEDFKKGYFTAIVDKEYSTTFKLRAINKNGETISEQLFVAPLEPPIRILEPHVNGNFISVELENHRKKVVDMSITDYKILDLKSSMVVGEGKVYDNKIDISLLEKGLYGLYVTDENSKSYDAKFVKK